ncbi:MAG TPA: DUF1549 and DUF1553 domain-containing protein [Pirellulales bacterium]|nr:DUF1549 and DUF1553 domain-containing protein [Pirellulales bacterium]
MYTIKRFALCLVIFLAWRGGALAANKPSRADDKPALWVLKPVVRPEVPAGLTQSPNPIDAFVAAQYASKGLKPVGPADKRALLRRVYLDLIGIPPTPAEQEAFLQDDSPDAYDKLVDHLLASPQHGVRYARHWLDVLRYADVDERMIAAPGIYLWRDWVINALNDDLPYDQFVRTQLTGYRSTERTQISSLGYRTRAEPRPDDMFAQGFLSRAAVLRDAKDAQELAITSTETISTAFMGLTVGCAKCHDHMYDPISQRDFYAMKALFDPLVVKKITLATPAEVFANGKAVDAAAKERAAIEGPIEQLIAPYKKKLYEDRVAMLPPEVQAVIRKPEKERSAEERKIADDYYPVLRIDSDKIREVMPAADRQRYQELEKQLGSLDREGRNSLPAFWTVEVDPIRAQQKSYILTSGDATRPEKNHEVQPGWPFAPANIDFHEGRVEAFSDWLTARDNPLLARVAVNRLWQWHFGEGLEKTPSDFGALGGVPVNPPLLEWLAAEFTNRNFSMKDMHRLIVTSDTYKMASEADPENLSSNQKVDSSDAYLWHFRLQRLEAEPIWDSILTAAGNLDTSVGGASFDISRPSGRRGGGFRNRPRTDNRVNRRAAYMIRGYATFGDIVPHFLKAFDVDDGRTPCPVRTQTVTAPQALFMMNGEEIDKAATSFADRLKHDSGGDLSAAVEQAYRTAIARPPSSAERERALAYLENDPARLKDFAWLLFNLDEFVYVR